MKKCCEAETFIPGECPKGQKLTCCSFSSPDSSVLLNGPGDIAMTDLARDCPHVHPPGPCTMRTRDGCRILQVRKAIDDYLGGS